MFQITLHFKGFIVALVIKNKNKKNTPNNNYPKAHYKHFEGFYVNQLMH